MDLTEEIGFFVTALDEEGFSPLKLKSKSREEDGDGDGFSPLKLKSKSREEDGLKLREEEDADSN